MSVIGWLDRLGLGIFKGLNLVGLGFMLRSCCVFSVDVRLDALHQGCYSAIA